MRIILTVQLRIDLSEPDQPEIVKQVVKSTIEDLLPDEIGGLVKVQDVMLNAVIGSGE